MVLKLKAVRDCETQVISSVVGYSYLASVVRFSCCHVNTSASLPRQFQTPIILQRAGRVPVQWPLTRRTLNGEWELENRETHGNGEGGSVSYSPRRRSPVYTIVTL